MQAAYSFDGAERLTNINQSKGSSTIFSASYSLDNLGNRTAIAENVSGTNRNLSYNYDELSRLTREGQQSGCNQHLCLRWGRQPQQNDKPVAAQ